MFFNLGGGCARNGLSLSSVVSSLFVLLLSLTVSYAQRTSAVISSDTIGNEEIRGRVFFPPGEISSAPPVVRLRSLSSPEVTGVTDRDGNFRFTHLRPDSYTIIVEGGAQYENASDTVSIGNSGPVPAQGNPGQYAVPYVYEVQIYLRPKRSNSASGQPATNPAWANVPVAARDLYQQALKTAQVGDHLKAIEQLKSAISKAPGFALAYNELAAQYLKLGQVDHAIRTLKEALQLSREDPTLRLNYGIALLNQKKFAVAETELRQAVRMNANSTTAHYYLGVALITQEKFALAQSEFESVVKNGGEKLALAHKYLGGIYWRNKKYREAADELEKYLKLDPKVADAEKIRSTIKELRHKS